MNCNNEILSSEAERISYVIEQYHKALDLLDAYDHQTLGRPRGQKGTTQFTYEECKRVIAGMSFCEQSSLFGNEKDDSFRGSIGAIYQTYGGQEMYPSVEEKAAHLLYFVVKNHSFSDGNKRIAAALFLYFLHKNGILLDAGHKKLDDSAVAALTILIAQSKPAEKDLMICLIMNCLC